MTQIPDNLAAVVDMLNTPIKHTLENQDALRKSVDELDRRVTRQEDKITVMERDFHELKSEIKGVKDQVDQVQKNILKEQKDSSRRIIAIQATILLLVLGGFITYAFLFLPHPH
jgi:peptidoglycan hydrolase CwlO-like protein